MQYFVKGRYHIAHCAFCERVLQITDKREPYCPRCDLTLSGETAEAILLCAVCEYPLRISEVGDEPAMYCSHCGTYPAPDDNEMVTKESICPMCRTCHEPGHCAPHHRMDN